MMYVGLINYFFWQIVLSMVGVCKAIEDRDKKNIVRDETKLWKGQYVINAVVSVLFIEISLNHKTII